MKRSVKLGNWGYLMTTKHTVPIQKPLLVEELETVLSVIRCDCGCGRHLIANIVSGSTALTYVCKDGSHESVVSADGVLVGFGKGGGNADAHRVYTIVCDCGCGRVIQINQSVVILTTVSGKCDSFVIPEGTKINITEPTER